MTRHVTMVAVALAFLASGCGGNNGTERDATDVGDASEVTTDADTDPSSDVPSEDVASTDTGEDSDTDASDVAEDVPRDELDEEAPTGGVVGDPCSEDDDCGGVPSTEAYCLEVGGGSVTFPNGYCTSDCDPSTDCGLGANCALSTLCLRLCSEDSDCRESEGYVCKTFLTSTMTYCLP